MLMSPGNTLIDIPRNNVLPPIWVSNWYIKLITTPACMQACWPIWCQWISLGQMNGWLWLSPSWIIIYFWFLLYCRPLLYCVPLWKFREKKVSTLAMYPLLLQSALLSPQMVPRSLSQIILDRSLYMKIFFPSLWFGESCFASKSRWITEFNWNAFSLKTCLQKSFSFSNNTPLSWAESHSFFLPWGICIASASSAELPSPPVVCVCVGFSKDEITPYWMETIHSHTEPEAGVMYLNRAIPHNQSTTVRWEEQVQKALPWLSEEQMLRMAEMILEQEKRIRGSVSSPRNAHDTARRILLTMGSVQDRGKSGDSSQLKWGMMLDPQRCSCGLRDYSSRKSEIPLPKLHL